MSAANVIFSTGTKTSEMEQIRYGITVRTMVEWPYAQRRTTMRSWMTS